MRIAFYGGMANNCYVVASQMRALGMEVIYIRDHLDNFAISQPVWEDQRLTLPFDELNASSTWPTERWDDVARHAGWTRPEWMIDPVFHPEQCEADFSRLGYKCRKMKLMNYLPAPADHYRSILALMRRQGHTSA